LTGTLRIGTRGSPLALVQAEMLRRAYLERFPEREAALVVVRTTGDQQADRALDSFAGQGVFVKELEAALREGRIEVAVHSAKDLASRDPEDLVLAAFLERGAPHDVLVRGRALSRPGAVPGPGTRIATGSPRRRAQLQEVWPGAEFTHIRGNVETRLRKLESGEADALVLAAAGLRRLELHPDGEEPLAVATCVPAPGQGAIVAQALRGGEAAQDLGWLNHFETSLAVQAERQMAAELGAGCAVPLGVHVTFRGGQTRLTAALHDGSALFRVEGRSRADRPAEAVAEAMAELERKGARWAAPA
jgi:hydroxymethylbilane synthase